MEIIHRELACGSDDYRDHAHKLALLPVVPLSVDRRTLAKTRWRATADDGQEFGFELAHPLTHGATVHQSATHRYVINQRQEMLLCVAVHTPEEAARVGWMIGNLHFPAQVRGNAIFVEADPAVRQMFAREGVAFDEAEGVFEPLKAAGGGHHHH